MSTWNTLETTCTEIRELTPQELEYVCGGRVSGFGVAGSIMTVVAFGSLFTPIGPVTAGITIGAASGMAIAEYLARLDTP